MPVALQFGINLVLFGVLMIVNLAIGNVTPPVGLDLFVVSAVTKISIDRIAKAMLSYLIVLIIDLLIVTYIPAIIMLIPTLLR